MAISEKLQNILNCKNDIKLSIQSINPSFNSNVLSEYAENINKDVLGETHFLYNDFIFTDFRGVVLYSFSKEEIQNMTELPVLNDLPGWRVPLTAQGWNYTLDELKLLNKAVVGGLYKPTDNKIHVFAKSPDRLKDIFPIRVGYTISEESAVKFTAYANGVEVSSKIPTGLTGYFYVNPVIPEVEYHITIEKLIDSATFKFGYSAYLCVGTYQQRCLVGVYMDDWCGIPSSCNQMFYFSDSPYISFAYNQEVDSEFTGVSMFYKSNVKCVVLPRSFTKITGVNFCYLCQNLKLVSLPPTLSEFNTKYSFAYSPLRVLYLPECITEINDFCTYYCQDLEQLSIPKSVTNISQYGFGLENNLILDVYCYPETPPTLNRTLGGRSSYFKCHVPYSSIDAYKNDSYWSAWSSQIEGDL